MRVLALLVAITSAAFAEPVQPAVRGRAIQPQAGSGATCTSLGYQGGAMIQHVKVVVVQWGSASAYASKVSSWYSTIVQSAFMDWLREYNKPGYSLTRGELLGVFTDPTPPSKTALSESGDVQPELSKLIANHTIPAPDADTLYMIHFGPGLSIGQGGGTSGSCAGWCGFHGGMQGSSGNIHYAIIPDFDASCAKGCGVGGSTDPFTAFAATASHEMIEAITDPDGDAWYDNQCGENGDICDTATTVGNAGGQPVQLIWSPKQQACVDHDSSVTVADYSLALDNMTVTAAPGGMATVKLTATPVSGSASLALAISGLPAKITSALQPASIITNARRRSRSTSPRASTSTRFTSPRRRPARPIT